MALMIKGATNSLKWEKGFVCQRGRLNFTLKTCGKGWIVTVKLTLLRQFVKPISSSKVDLILASL